MKRLLLIIGFLICAISIFAQGTYKLTGELKVKRSQEAKKEFLRSKGLKKTPPGYQIDHIKPLFEGGSDTPDNMELLTIQQHKAKTERELAPYKHVSKSGNVYYPKQSFTPYSNKMTSLRSHSSTQKSGYHYSGGKSYYRKK
jgi:hypothetical protein